MATEPAARATDPALLTARRVAPSILSADYARLGEHVAEVMDAGARVIHVDVMDGHFVPPITIGPVVVAALRDQIHDAGGVIDVHLMIERPETQLDAFTRAGADLITVHVEATPHVHYALKAIRDAGCLAGVALNPGTPAEAVEPLADMVDLVLCMSVNPGWGGQRFIASTLPKIRKLAEVLSAPIEVDGGVGEETVSACADAGATVFVAGSAIFEAENPTTAYRRIAAAGGAA